MDYGSFLESYNIIQTWKPESDVYAFKYYPFVTGTVSAMSGAYVNGFYRNKVKLRNRVYFPTALPMIFLPVVVSTILHHQFVQRPLIEKNFQCPVCIELRGGAFQLFAGFIYPMVLGPVSSFHFANTLYTYDLPTLKEPKKLWEVYMKFTRPALHKFSLLAGIQVVIGMALTHAEAHNLFTVLSKLSMMEEKVKEHSALRSESISY